MTVHVTYDVGRGGYIGTHEHLREPMIMLSLGALRRRAEALLMPKSPLIKLSLDRQARLERDRRRTGGVFERRAWPK
jgi:hypothetical protein